MDPRTVISHTDGKINSDQGGERKPMDISEAVCQKVYIAKDKCGCVMGSTIVVEIEEDLQLFNQVALMVRKWIEKGWTVEKTSGPVLVTGCKCQKQTSERLGVNSVG
jgi:hypothetical protein